MTSHNRIAFRVSLFTSPNLTCSLSGRRYGKTACAIIFCLIGLSVLSGCPANLNRAPGSTEKWTDQNTGGKYLLYIPSWHNNEQQWPLVVTCHGTIPWDTADLQMMEWRRLAENVGFILASPRLTGTNGTSITTRRAQLKRQGRDEALILNVVQRAISSLNVDPTRVYIVGWSGGGYAVYYTGLRNPAVFRAAATRMGTFKKEYLPDLAQRMDPYQPVGIFFGSEDVLPGINAQCRRAAKYLKSLGFKRVKLREVTGGHRRRPELAFRFFKEVTEKYAFVKLSAVTAVGGDPLAVQFYLKVDPPARAVLWEFGDGTTSTEPEPRHRYKQPGSYTVKANIVTARTARTARQIKVNVGT